jgi:quercetin dioxygenase-like cupin family protein
VKPERTTTAKVLVSADLSDICPGKELVVSAIDFSAGDSPKHYHPGHLVSYIVSGSEHVTVEGKVSRTLKAGDVEYLKPREAHSTTSAAPVRELAIRVAKKGQSGSFPVP